MAARVGACDSVSQDARGRSDRHCCRSAAPLYGDLPGGEAHLDTELDPIQRRTVLPVPRRVLLAGGNAQLPEGGVPAGGDRDEFDRGLHDRPPVGEVHHRLVPDSSGREFLPGFRNRARTAIARACGACGFLADSLLDVPAETVPAGLTSQPESRARGVGRWHPPDFPTLMVLYSTVLRLS